MHVYILTAADTDLCRDQGAEDNADAILYSGTAYGNITSAIIAAQTEVNEDWFEDGNEGPAPGLEWNQQSEGVWMAECPVVESRRWMIRRQEVL